jgi:hypothetical protein
MAMVEWSAVDGGTSVGLKGMEKPEMTKARK